MFGEEKTFFCQGKQAQWLHNSCLLTIKFSLYVKCAKITFQKSLIVQIIFHSNLITEKTIVKDATALSNEYS